VNNKGKDYLEHVRIARSITLKQILKIAHKAVDCLKGLRIGTVKGFCEYD
jgi:hypothetical protein